MNSTGGHHSGATNRNWLLWGLVVLLVCIPLLFIPVMTCPECNGTKGATIIIVGPIESRVGPCGWCRSKGRLSLYSRFLDLPDPAVW